MYKREELPGGRDGSRRPRPRGGAHSGFRGLQGLVGNSVVNELVRAGRSTDLPIQRATSIDPRRLLNAAARPPSCAPGVSRRAQGESGPIPATVQRAGGAYFGYEPEPDDVEFMDFSNSGHRHAAASPPPYGHGESSSAPGYGYGQGESSSPRHYNPDEYEDFYSQFEPLGNVEPQADLAGSSELYANFNQGGALTGAGSPQQAATAEPPLETYGRNPAAYVAAGELGTLPPERDPGGRIAKIDEKKIRNGVAFIKSGWTLKGAAEQIEMAESTFRWQHNALVEAGILDPLPKRDPRSKMDPAKIKQGDELIRAGSTRQDAAGRMGMQLSTFMRHHGALVKAGLLHELPPDPYHQGRPTNIDELKIRRGDELLRSGWSMQDTAKEIKIHKDTFKKHHAMLVEEGVLAPLPALRGAGVIDEQKIKRGDELVRSGRSVSSAVEEIGMKVTTFKSQHKVLVRAGKLAALPSGGGGKRPRR